jgi:hypothetical protein
MAISAEAIRDYLPYYLTEEAKVGIINELKKFHVGEMQYYLLSRYQQEMLQGDGWTRLHLRRFHTGEKIFINGVVLSNTCDVDPSNKRDLPVNIIFAPLIAVDAYVQRLIAAGVASQSIDAKVTAMRRQETNVFYVPAGGGLAAPPLSATLTKAVMLAKRSIPTSYCLQMPDSLFARGAIFFRRSLLISVRESRSQE